MYDYHVDIISYGRTSYKKQPPSCMFKDEKERPCFQNATMSIRTPSSFASVGL